MLAVDLGTTSTLIAAPGRGIVLDEPSVVAIDARDGRIVGHGRAVGHLACEMEGKTGERIEVVRPMARGVIADFTQCEAMLRTFFHKVGYGGWRRPDVLVSVPERITAVERRAVFNSFHRAGSGSIWLIPKATAAALGAGLPIAEPIASMICDIGGGTTETSLLSLTQRIAGLSLTTAGQEFDRSIVDYLHRRYSLKISAQVASRLRIDGGSAYPLDEERSLGVAGLDAFGGSPRRATVTTEEIRHALAEPLEEIAQAVRLTVEQSGPDLASDLIDRGMVLCGGAALLPGLDRYLTEQTGIPSRLAPAPRKTVVEGMQICIEHFAQWRKVLQSDDDDV